MHAGKKREISNNIILDNNNNNKQILRSVESKQLFCGTVQRCRHNSLSVNEKSVYLIMLDIYYYYSNMFC